MIALLLQIETQLSGSSDRFTKRVFLLLFRSDLVRQLSRGLL
jgi:hypothetical protein